MAQHTTEAIWHFIGYLHIAELLSAPAIHYSGGLAPTPIRIEAGPSGTPVGGIAPGGPGPGGPTPMIAFHSPDSGLALRPIHARLNPQLEADGHGGWSLRIPPVAQGASPAVWGIGRELGPYSIEIEYHDVLSHQQIVDVDQTNALLDLDQFGLAPGVAPILAVDTLESLIGRAEALVPVGADDSGFRPQNIAREIDQVGAPPTDGPLTVDTDGSLAALTAPIEDGRHVNGEHVDADITSREASGEILAGMRSALRVARGEEPASTTIDRGTSEAEAEAGPPPEPVTLALDVGPTGGNVQHAITGENHLVNAAILQDRSESLGSSIIMGDRHETNSIVQINVFQGEDHTGSGLADLVQQQLGPPTLLVNDAVMLDDQLLTYSNGRHALVSGNLEWQVTYMNGSYWDLTTVRQANVVLDNDISLQTQTQSHFVLTQGGNGAINEANLLERADAYDLVIVAGDYYELNSVVQINVVLDDDVIIRNGTDGFGTTGGVLADGNALVNQAAIISIGGEGYVPLDAEAELIAESVANRETGITLSDPIASAGRQSGPLNVLYIDGNYYNHNVLVQTNVLADVDVVAQNDMAAGAEGVPQIAETGGNTATNVALLINNDSLSDFQHLAGTNYEENVLFQANIIVDDATAAEAGDLHPDVVAAIAAISGQALDDVEATAVVPDVGHVLDVDVLGGVLH